MAEESETAQNLVPKVLDLIDEWESAGRLTTAEAARIRKAARTFMVVQKVASQKVPLNQNNGLKNR